MDEEAHRRQTGRAVHPIVFPPDHGHELLSEIGCCTHHGYPLIGRMGGFLELRGIVHAMEHPQNT